MSFTVTIEDVALTQPTSYFKGLQQNLWVKAGIEGRAISCPDVGGG